MELTKEGDEYLTHQDMLQKARIIWKKDKFKKRTIACEDRYFRTYFGCGLLVCHKVWRMLLTYGLHPGPPLCNHYLWALLFLKVYPKANVLCNLTGVQDYKTLKQKIFPYISAVAALEEYVVCISCLIFYHNQNYISHFSDCME